MTSFSLASPDVGVARTRRRVLLVHHSFHAVGGAELYVDAVARALAARGVDVAVAAVHGWNGDSPQDAARPEVLRIDTRQLYQAGVATPTLAQKLLWHLIDPVNPTGRASLGRILDTFRPDVVHTHNVQGIGGGALRLLRRWPHVHTVHDFSLVDPRCTLTDWQGNVRTSLPLPLRARAAVVARNFAPDVTIFPSERVKGFHARVGWRARSGNVRVIPHGWPIDGVAAPKHTPLDRPTRFLYLGRLSEHKGLALLLDAWERFEGEGELVIAGEGPMEQAVRDVASRRSDVTYVGFVSGGRKWDVLTSSDCMLFPSLWPEVFPLTCAEAYLTGIPLIATEVGAPPPLEPGVNGLTVDENAPDLAAALSRFAQDAALRTRLALAARATGEDLGWDRHIDRLEEVYGCVDAA